MIEQRLAAAYMSPMETLATSVNTTIAAKTIAVETSGRPGSLAALTATGNETVLERFVELDHTKGTAQSLAPALRDLLAEIAWSPQSIDLVAVAVGPGSFTGLRIGVTMAKALAYAVGADVVGVNSLSAISVRVPAAPSPLWAIMDAQRQELFAAKFSADQSGRVKIDGDTRIVSRDAWLADLKAGDRVTGPALGRLLRQLPQGVIVVPEDNWQPSAVAVGQLAWQCYCDGHVDDVWTLSPAYYRPSAAEEKAARRHLPAEH